MKTIDAAEFSAGCLEIVDEVAASGEVVVITRDGRPVARLEPVTSRPRSLIGLHRGQIEILGDIISPLDVEWEAQR